MLDAGVHVLLVHLSTGLKQKRGNGVPSEVAKSCKRGHVIDWPIRSRH